MDNAAINMSVLLEYLLSVLLGIHLKGELLGRMVILCFTAHVTFVIKNTHKKETRGRETLT